MKNYAIWPCLVAVFVALLSFSCFASEMVVRGNDEGLLVREILAVRKSNKAVSVDVSDIVVNYIKQGIGAETAESLLKFYGFDVSRRVYREVMYVYGVNKREKNILGFGDDIYVICELRNGHVVNVVGKIMPIGS